jgi:hypothetical protein
MAEDIRLSDVRWIVRYRERLSDAPLRSGLLASGATPDEPYFYTRALRMGIQQIQKVARGRTMVARAK